MAPFQHVKQLFSRTKAETPGKPPRFLAFRSSTFLIVATVNLAIFTDIFFYALIVPVLPFALSTQAGVAEDDVQTWVSILLAAYSAALFIGSPASGIYADHTSSRRWPLLLGLAALAGATFLLAFGNSVGLFIVGRLLQGLSAAVVWSVGCALLVDTVGSSVGVAMGYVSTSMSVALLLAPIIGGVLYNNVGYVAVYYVAFGVVGLDIVLRLVMIEKKIARQWIKDPEAETTSQSDVEKNTQGDSSAEEPPKSSTIPTETETGITTAEPRASQSDDQSSDEKGDKKKNRLRPLIELLKSPRLLVALYGILVESGILLGFDAVLALFVRGLFEWNATAVAVLFLALFIPGFIAPLAGWLSDRYGAKWPSFAGFVATIPVLISLRFVTENNIGHKVLLAVLLALAGATLPFSMTPLMAEISYVIEAKEAENPGIFGEKGVYGLAYGLFNMAFALGGIIGPIWAGYVVDSAGWGTLTWNFGLWAASAALAVFIFGANKPKTPTTEDTPTESA
ncbi:MFS transporter-like protein [Xylaria bambusicola]|uniref:MFS transporter-like protein n=1 Tax=Xylaria bambusicola TaxID=326684 RepID=UPI002007856B|nr:MFS transporter-like protein [Xylaria bambusicola]KAI0528258.1 MFS transporter-like protein [Xylaria bambusicola]